MRISTQTLQIIIPEAPEMLVFCHWIHTFKSCGASSSDASDKATSEPVCSDISKGDLSPGFPALKGFRAEDQEQAVVVVKKIEDSG